MDNDALMDKLTSMDLRRASPEEREAARQAALALVAENVPYAEVAVRVGASKSVVGQWVAMSRVEVVPAMLGRPRLALNDGERRERRRERRRARAVARNLVQGLVRDEPIARRAGGEELALYEVRLRHVLGALVEAGYDVQRLWRQARLNAGAAKIMRTSLPGLRREREEHLDALDLHSSRRVDRVEMRAPGALDVHQTEDVLVELLDASRQGHDPDQ